MSNLQKRVHGKSETATLPARLLQSLPTVLDHTREEWKQSSEMRGV